MKGPKIDVILEASGSDNRQSEQKGASGQWRNQDKGISWYRVVYRRLMDTGTLGSGVNCVDNAVGSCQEATAGYGIAMFKKEG